MSKRAAEKPTQPNRSIEWGIKCLMELTAAERPVSINEMVERLGVERTKASRLLGTLASLGMAERLQDLSYVPGPGIHVLSAMSLRGSGMLRHAFPYIQQFEEKWNVSVGLGVVWQNEVAYLYHSGGRQDIGSSIGGTRIHLVTESSIGRVVLAQKDDEIVADLIRGIVNEREFDAYMQSISRIRSRGYSLNPGFNLTMAIGSRATAGLALLGEACTAESTELIEELQAAVNSIAEKTKLRD